MPVLQQGKEIGALECLARGVPVLFDSENIENGIEKVGRESTGDGDCRAAKQQVLQLLDIFVGDEI
ncbi:MAG: hypothetical protein E5W39_15235, partial [Mesorhizobium sp.]